MPQRCKYPISALLRFRAPTYDWPQLICELGSVGVTLKAIAGACGRNHRSASDWKNQGVVPRHEDGETILALHAHFCPGRCQRKGVSIRLYTREARP